MADSKFKVVGASSVEGDQPALKSAKPKRRRRKPQASPITELSLVFLKYGARIVEPDLEHEKVRGAFAEPRRVAGVHNTEHFPLDRGVMVVGVSIPATNRQGFAVGRKTVTSAFSIASAAEYQIAHGEVARAFATDVRRAKVTAFEVQSSYFPPCKGLAKLNMEDALPTGHRLTAGTTDPLTPTRRRRQSQGPKSE